MRANRMNIGLLALLLFAFALRVYRLDEIPPGLYRDEAYNGIDALRILQTGDLPIFFEANTGREPLFIYLQTIAVALLGARDWTLRLVSVFVGTLTIALLYRVGIELFSSVPRRARWVAILAAVGLTVSYWHLHFSRMGFRAFLIPALSLLAIRFFWRGWHNGNRRDWFSSGAAVAAALYTYTAARFLPIVIVLFVVAQFLFERLWHGDSKSSESDVRRRLFGLAIMTLTAALLFLPLAFYFLRDPGALLTHSRELTVLDPANPLRDWWRVQENTIAVVRMFIDRGDPWVKENLPNRAALDAITAIGFWIGLAGAVIQVRKPVYTLLLVWLGVMLLPTILSSDAPNYVRAMGALPPIYFLVADGLTRLWERVAPRMSPVWLMLGVLTLSGATTTLDYFVRWAPSPETFQEYDAGIVTISESVPSLVRDYDVILPFEFYGQPTPRLIFLNAFPPSRPLAQPWHSSKPLAFITTERNVVDSAVALFHLDQTGTTLIPGLLDSATVATLRQRVASSDFIPIRDIWGRQVGKLIEIKNGITLPALVPSNPSGVRFGDEIKLMGFDLHPTIAAPGETVALTLYWEALANLRRTRTMSIALKDAMDYAWVTVAREPWDGNFATDLWRKDEVIPDTFQIRVPADLPNGKFRFQVEIYSTEEPDKVLGVTNVAGQSLGDQTTLGVLTVNATQARQAKYPVQLRFGNPPVVDLQGLTFDPAAFQPDGEFAIELAWHSERVTETDYTVFIHLLDQRGKLVAQHDSQPQNNFAPTSFWSAGETVFDSHLLTLPENITEGDFTLVVGLYDLKTGERLPAFNIQGERADSDQLPVATIRRHSDGKVSLP